jgi:hypothetical protein
MGKMLKMLFFELPKHKQFRGGAAAKESQLRPGIE